MDSRISMTQHRSQGLISIFRRTPMLSFFYILYSYLIIVDFMYYKYYDKIMIIYDQDGFNLIIDLFISLSN